jgi:hypothetical protein
VSPVPLPPHATPATSAPLNASPVRAAAAVCPAGSLSPACGAGSACEPPSPFRARGAAVDASVYRLAGAVPDLDSRVCLSTGIGLSARGLAQRIGSINHEPQRDVGALPNNMVPLEDDPADDCFRVAGR